MTETKITVLVTEALRRRAKAAAALQGETLSQVVRSKLEEYVEETEHLKRDAKQALRTDPLLSLRFSGGPGDVAERVEEILAAAADPVTGLDVGE
jgi:alkanesulfonate monooxygenase SsuD/methylene tetrahydromethanopterin reductase-like flavin-dependent oxidoreductase (luciferase family)